MSLKQMIDEAKMLADSRPASVAASMEDINMYRRSSDAKTPIQSDFEERRSQSAVSVIDQEAEREAERAAQRCAERRGHCKCRARAHSDAAASG